MALTLEKNLGRLHAEGYTVAWSQEGSALCRVKVYRSWIKGWLVFIWTFLTKTSKVYINHEAKKYILFNAKEYLERNAINNASLKKRVFSLASQIPHRGESLQELFSTLLFPYSGESEEVWAKRIIDTFEIKKGENASFKKILLSSFPPTKIGFYKSLQLQIAKIIPKEPLRPSVDLTVRGDRAQSKTVGILGGMGPISDAEIIEGALSLLTDIDKAKVSIDVFSFPPPRTLWQQIKRGLKYISDVESFALRCPIHKIYLASNTAHAGFSDWQKMCQGKLVNLVDVVADQLQNRKEACFLILSTLEAYEKKLYQSKLSSRNINYLEVSQEDSVALQRIIDHAKEHRLEGNDCQEILRIIRSKSGATHLLLGCTELSIVFHRFSELGKECGLKIVNTKEIFSRTIAYAAVEAS